MTADASSDAPDPWKRIVAAKEARRAAIRDLPIEEKFAIWERLRARNREIAALRAQWSTAAEPPRSS